MTGAPARAPDGPVTVVVIEDHAVLADALVRAFARGEEIDVLDTAGDLATGRSIVAARRPDVVLLDVVLPDGDGVVAVRDLTDRSPGTAVVVMTGMARHAVVARAIRAGASGFLSKTQPLADIVRAVLDAANGHVSFTHDQLRRATADGPAAMESLTDRENEVLQLLCVGASTDDIARQLTLSAHTVRNHVRNLTTKLEVSSRLEAVAVAHRHGLATPPTSP